MLSSSSILAATFAVFVGLAQAQNSTGTATTKPYSYTVAPGSVAPTLAASYCRSEEDTCRQVCGGFAPTHGCDPTTFVYSCACSDGTMPDMTQYDNSLPYHECQEYKAQQIQKTDDAQKQQAIQDIQCGGKDPIAAQSEISASRASAMNTASATSDSSSSDSTGSSSNSATSAPPSNAAISAHSSLSSTYGLMAFVASGMVLFGGALAL